ncbi:MAG TPA: crotonase/enoyl-CoA hydratase family protein [Pyrinomonadaceae bacterium]|jgi:enoyl-CoA hydratase/carnithine racemase|nr:crotonase/enoyl-CoA hydratase family protein [Pyrinomonadaceae bacterium]
METQETESKISVEQRGHILLIGLNRPAKRNAFDLEMLDQLALAYAELEDNDEIRCGVLFAEGEMFTAGLDLANVAPKVVENGVLTYPEGAIDPLNLYTERLRTKPLITAVQGKCLTVGIELLLASDIGVASENATFAQIEIKRGIFPFGGATLRFPERSGWGNAMRWLLTGDEFDAREALRIGLIQEVTENGKQLEKAIEIATRIAKQAPLGVRATIESARKAQTEGFTKAKEHLTPQILGLFASEDAKEGVQSFLERRDGNFSGK